MNSTDPPEDDPRLDAILRAATRSTADPSDEAEPDDAVDDGLIRAWQAGRLDDETAAMVEDQLARSAEARAVAHAALEPVPEALFEWAERQGPTAATAPTAEPQTPTPQRSTSPFRLVLAFAAVTLMGVGLTLMMRDTSSAPDYVASGLEGGLADVRSEGPSAEVPVFTPANMLRIKLRPQVAGEPPPVHVYVSRPDGPLRPGGFQTRTAPGGAVVVEAPAGGLFAEEDGDWRFYVALGQLDGDPAGRPHDPEAHPSARWFVYPLRYVVDDGGAP